MRSYIAPSVVLYYRQIFSKVVRGPFDLFILLAFHFFSQLPSSFVVHLFSVKKGKVKRYSISVLSLTHVPN